MTVKQLIGIVVVVFLILTGVILGFKSMTTVPAGFAGVVYNLNGGIEKETLNQGLHWVLPTQSVIKYPVSTENVYYVKGAHEGRKGVDDSFGITTKDGKPVTIEYQFAYHFDKSMLPKIYTNFKGQDSDYIEYNFMKTETGNIINSLASHYTTVDLFEKRAEFAANIQKGITKLFMEHGIVIESTNLSNVVPDAQTQQMIQQVVDNQQKMKIAQLEKERASVEADKQKTIAEGNAAATRIAADAQAYANTKLTLSITPELVQYEIAKGFREHWNGQYPSTFMGGGSGNILYQLTGK
jgi:regulator of protease activity HflC (stomatin/prohibitin superfamily)